MAETNEQGLACVQWGEHRISRLLVGHNPFKGTSHFTKALDEEMGEWLDPKLSHDLEILRRCEECGINTAQFGAPLMHSLLNRFTAEGGHIQWIATVYDQKEDLEEELKVILAVNPKPIGLIYYGGSTDRHFFDGKLDSVEDKIKRLRDTGLLVGLGTHLPKVGSHAEEKGWDVDFYHTCVYTVYSGGRYVDREHERYEAEDREKMVGFIKQASKPCLAFKVLAAGRNCGSEEEVVAAFEFVFANIKKSDVVLTGMWNKHRDEVGQNTAFVRKILAQQS